MVDLDSLIKEFTFPKKNVENLIALYLDGNTVPFIARYRKEQTGAMDEIQIRNILERYEYLENLNKRKEEVIKNIDEKGKLTDKLKLALQKAATLTEVEDLYAPYKSKKKTKADIAREAGIEPVAEYIKTHNDLSELENFAKDYINEKAADIDTVLSMARDIITEDIGHNINIKNRLREIYNKNAVISSAAAEDFQERTPYEAYYEFEEKIKTLPPHRVLAIFRGEREHVLKVKLNIDEETCINTVLAIIYEEGYKHNKIIEKLREKISNDTSNEPADDYKLFLEKQDKFYSAIIEFANMIKIDDEKIEKFLGIKVSYTTGLMWSGRGIENRGDLEKGDKILSVNAFDIQIPYENGKELQTNFKENKKLQYINWALGYLERKLNFCVDQHFFSHKVWGEKHIFQFIKLYEGVEYCDDIYEFVDDQVKEKLNNSESSEETML